MTVKIVDTDYESQLNYDMKEPCNDCPFRKSTPWDMKGVGIDKLNFMVDTIVYGQEGAHTCHKTDPRADYEPAKDYKGGLQHCVGFLRMCEKGFSRKLSSRTGTAHRAILAGKLDPAILADPKDEVSSLKDLVDACREWALSPHEPNCKCEDCQQ